MQSITLCDARSHADRFLRQKSAQQRSREGKNNTDRISDYEWRRRKKTHESNKNVERFTVTQCRKTNGHDRTTNYMYNQNAFRDNIYHTMT